MCFPCVWPLGEEGRRSKSCCPFRKYTAHRTAFNLFGESQPMKPTNYCSLMCANSFIVCDRVWVWLHRQHSWQSYFDSNVPAVNWDFFYFGHKLFGTASLLCFHCPDGGVTSSVIHFANLKHEGLK